MENDEFREVEYSPTLIKDMAECDRPREKAMKHTVKALTDAELMALVFATGIKGKSVLDLCTDILKDNDWHLSKIADMSIKELTGKYKGIGIAKSTTLLAVLELGARAERDRLRVERPVINMPEIATALMRPHFQRLQHEEFWVMLLDRGGHNIGEVQVSKGGTAATSVDVKIILKAAVEALASSMLLFHNHPSGTLLPSPEDDRLTKKIAEAARLLDMRVNDHIIVTDAGFYSFADHGRL